MPLKFLQSLFSPLLLINGTITSFFQSPDTITFKSSVTHSPNQLIISIFNYHIRNFVACSECKTCDSAPSSILKLKGKWIHSFKIKLIKLYILFTSLKILWISIILPALLAQKLSDCSTSGHVFLFKKTKAIKLYITPKVFDEYIST